MRVGHLQILSAWDHRCSAKPYPLPLTVPLSIFSIGCATFDACGLCTKSGWNPSGFQSVSMFALVAAWGFMSVQGFFNNRGLVKVEGQRVGTNILLHQVSIHRRAGNDIAAGKNVTCFHLPTKETTMRHYKVDLAAEPGGFHNLRPGQPCGKVKQNEFYFARKIVNVFLDFIWLGHHLLFLD